MIKYRLLCKNCKNSFDSWFSSSKEYEKLKKTKHLNCYSCNSFEIEKTLMAPSVLNTKKKISLNSNEIKFLKFKKKIKKYQKFIKDNFKYVGKNFVYEARSLHYDNKKKIKGIYGKATTEEVTELKEEGIEADVVPWINDRDN